MIMTEGVCCFLERSWKPTIFSSVFNDIYRICVPTEVLINNKCFKPRASLSVKSFIMTRETSTWRSWECINWKFCILVERSLMNGCWRIVYPSEILLIFWRSWHSIKMIVLSSICTSWLARSYLVLHLLYVPSVCPVRIKFIYPSNFN